MAKQVNISKEKPLHPSMDYKALYKEGIERIQQYSGAVWTDYNLHDPGVTLLEYLCFGITDVGYRCNFPVTDLLYALEDKKLRPVDNAFFAPHKILPCAPLTANDYRQLILDHLIGSVHNVWVEPATNLRKVFEGLYTIRIQLDEETDVEKDPKEIEKKVRRLFCEHRNLCEDIDTITVLKSNFLKIETVVHLEPDASAEQVLAALLHELEHFLMPLTRLYSFDELQAEGLDINDILDGPEPVHGFIKTAGLQPLSSVLHASQLRNVIAAVAGVRSIGQLVIKLNSVPQEEEIKAPDNTYITLHRDMLDVKNCPIRLYRNGLPVVPEEVIVRQILHAFRAREYQGFRQRLDLKTLLPFSEKDLADIGAYFSIQRFFPAVYGIGVYGLPRDADYMRQAEARQLKGYLAIFEIMLAGYLKQLTQLRHLFSIEEKTPSGETQSDPTYFAQFPFDIPDVEALLAADGPGHTAFENQNSEVDTLLRAANISQYHAFINRQLAEFTAISDHSSDRRNDFLDHLLARFGETFNGDLLRQLYTDSADAATLKRHLIDAKSRILREYDVLSRERGRGFNYLNPDQITEKQLQPKAPWSSVEVSGLKKRLCYWLNLKCFEDRKLTDFSHFDLIKKGDSDDTAHKAALPLRSILKSGRFPENYEIKKNNGRYGGWEVYFRENADSEAFVLAAKSRQEAVERLADFLKKIAAFDENSSGFFIVEHVLLRPQREKGQKLLLKIDLTGARESNPDQLLPAPPGPAAEFLFESRGFDKNMKELEDLIRDVLVIGSDRRNYEHGPDGKIFLKQGVRILLFSAGTFGQEEAKAWCDFLPAYLYQVLTKQPERLGDWVDFDSEPAAGPKVKNEFYAHRMSIVAPAWAGIFMESANRSLFKNLVAQHVPAHLSVDFHWLNRTNMQDFEEVYLKWLYEKSRPQAALSRLDECAARVIEILTAGKQEYLETNG